MFESITSSIRSIRRRTRTSWRCIVVHVAGLIARIFNVDNNMRANGSDDTARRKGLKVIRKVRNDAVCHRIIVEGVWRM